MTIVRAALVATVLSCLITVPLAGEAQQTGTAHRIGVLTEDKVGPASRLVTGMRKALQDHGWTDQNLLIEWRSSGGDAKRLPALAKDLAQLKVDAIIAVRNSSIAAARQATSSIPIVMFAASDPVGSGFVASYARPGGNVTGVTPHALPIVGNLLQVLKAALPDARQVSIILEPEFPGTPAYVREANAAAQALGLRIQYLEVRRPADVDAALTRLGTERPDALMAWTTGVISVERRRIYAFATKHKLPTIVPGVRVHAEDGALIAYSSNLDEMFGRTASLVDKILKGAKPADLPVEQPTRYELVLNMKTAKALGLTIPPSLLLRADHVIE